MPKDLYGEIETMFEDRPQAWLTAINRAYEEDIRIKRKAIIDKLAPNSVMSLLKVPSLKRH